MLYVWSVQTGGLVKSLDAHFARINDIQPLTFSNWNCLVTSSMDRTVKVWNLNNIFEEVHHIDRLETQIESISLCVAANTAVTVTRGCIGVWNLLTGKLNSRLADSAYGAIVSHAVVTSNGDLIVAAECGYVIYWDAKDRKVLFKQEQRNILQVMLYAKESTTMVVSRMMPENIANCIARDIPEGEVMFEFEFAFKQFKNVVLTADSQFFVCYGFEKSKDMLSLYCAASGILYQKFTIPKYPNFKEPTMIVAMPDKPMEIALIDQDKGNILDAENKRLVRVIPTWGGRKNYCLRY